MMASLGGITRYIPVHTLAKKSGDVCKILPALHMLTGCNVSSKFGTKASALNAEPEVHLKNFGMNPHNSNLERVITHAEDFLVQVLKRDTGCKNLDQLRYTIMARMLQ